MNNKIALMKFFDYLKLLASVIILSYICGCILLFTYIFEYSAPFPTSISVLSVFAKFFLLLFGIGVAFSLGPEFMYKTALSVIAIATATIMFLGFFPKWQYSPQRIILRASGMGGKTVSYKLKTSQYGNFGLSGNTGKAYLIYTGKYFYYFATKNGTTGINKKVCYIVNIY